MNKKNFEFNMGFMENPVEMNCLLLHQLGELSCQNNYIVEEHNQWCSEITYIISGKGICSFNGREYHIRKGDLLISPVGAIHSILSTDNLRFYYLGFELKPHIDEELRNFYITPTTEILTEKNNVYETFMKCVNEYFHKKTFYKLMAESYILSMLIRIYRDSCIEQDVIIKSDEKLVHFTEPVVYSIIRYIDNNIEDIRNIKDLAKKMGYNNCYISHLFRDKLNTSASEYLNKMKIERSKWLLHRYTVTEVADMMNFSSIQSFSRIFKMIEGVNPAEYIKQNNLKNKYSPN